MPGEEPQIAQRDALQVARALAQRGHPNRDDVQPIEQVLAEAALLDGLFEVAVGRGNDPHVGPARFGFAHALIFLLLQQPEQLGLDFERQLADLIQKERAAVRQRDLAQGVPHRAGKRAFDMAEEFALQQLAREAGAIDGDEGVVLLRAVGVDGAGQHGLAGAALAEQEDRRRCRRRLGGQLEHLLHRRLGGGQLGRGRIGREARFEVGDALTEPARLQDAVEHAPDLLRGKGLGDVIRRAAAHGFDRGLDGSVGREDHHLQARVDLQHLRQQIQPALAVQFQIQERQVEVVRLPVA